MVINLQYCYVLYANQVIHNINPVGRVFMPKESLHKDKVNLQAIVFREVRPKQLLQLPIHLHNNHQGF